MSDDQDIDIAALKKRMDGALASLRTEFASLRTGRYSRVYVDPSMRAISESAMPSVYDPMRT